MTQLPPGPGPKKGPAKTEPPKKDAWDDVLGDQSVESIPPDLARRLLDMNPKLREDGVDTSWVVERSQKAAKEQARTPAQQQKAKGPQSGRAIDALGEVRRQLETDEARVDAELAKLQRERAGLKQQALEKFCRWLNQNDPD